MEFSINIGLGKLVGLRNRGEWGNRSLLGVMLFALTVAINVGSRAAWLSAIAAICAIGLAAWVGNTRRQRLLHDLPTSRIASAAQGYAELSGRIAQDEQKLFAKLSLIPCAWYRYQIEKKDNDGHWQVDEFGSSDDTFVMSDPTGRCIIDPKGAEITTWHKDVWIESDTRYTEYLLLPNDDLYAVGDFTTLSYDTSAQTLKNDVGALLAEWKSDRNALLRRFDTNQDGEIDLAEWEKARQAAQQEIRTQQQEPSADNPAHLLRRPKSTRPFLLSNLGHEKLGRRYRVWAWVHLVIFFIGCGGLAYWFLG